jgi:hypothetical protein
LIGSDQPDFKNVDAAAGTVDIEYQLVEKGSSQIELQGGYGGGGFIGTVGLSFNNFLQETSSKRAYKPLPMGDGQKCRYVYKQPFPNVRQCVFRTMVPDKSQYNLALLYRIVNNS